MLTSSLHLTFPCLPFLLLAVRLHHATVKLAGRMTGERLQK